MTSCKSEYTLLKQLFHGYNLLHHNNCYISTRTCTFNGGSGFKLYIKDTVGQYTGCQTDTCNSDYVKHGSACLAKKIACTADELSSIPQATAGTRSYLSNGNYNTTCVVTACTTGYKVANGICEKPDKGKYVNSQGKENGLL